MSLSQFVILSKINIFIWLLCTPMHRSAKVKWGQINKGIWVNWGQMRPSDVIWHKVNHVKSFEAKKGQLRSNEVSWSKMGSMHAFYTHTYAHTQAHKSEICFIQRRWQEFYSTVTKTNIGTRKCGPTSITYNTVLHNTERNTELK